MLNLRTYVEYLTCAYNCYDMCGSVITEQSGTLVTLAHKSFKILNKMADGLDFNKI